MAWIGGHHGRGKWKLGRKEIISTFDGVGGGDQREKGKRDSA